jgi:6-phosphogluconolactonase (cycloisomerase 2 family)
VASERARVPASADGGPAQPSELAVAASGRYLYLANRGPDMIAVFALEDGLPRRVAEVPCGGRWPRHFAVWDGLLYVANERSHTVVTFDVTGVDGVPISVGTLNVPSPTCVSPPGMVSM